MSPISNPAESEWPHNRDVEARKQRSEHTTEGEVKDDTLALPEVWKETQNSPIWETILVAVNGPIKEVLCCNPGWARSERPQDNKPK